MFNEKVCFAIDRNHDLHTTAKFTRFLDTLRALGELQGSVIQCIGCWNGELEPSYLMDRKDFHKWVDESGYLDEQHCVMLIPGDTRQPCSLLYDDDEQISIGPLREVANTIGLTAWTYVIETGKYFTTEER